MAITTQLNGGSIFTAVIPLYLTASTPGTYTFYTSNVDDVFLYSIDGGSFVSSGQGSDVFINFTANQIHRLVLWYQNTLATGAYLNLSFDPNISIWSLPDPTSIQGSLPNLIPTTTTTTGLSQGVSGLIFYNNESAYGVGMAPSLGVVSYTDTSLPIPQPSGKFTSAKVNYWTDLQGFTRPSGTIDWPIVTGVAKLSQTITFFSTIPSQTPGASPFTITPPTSSSGLSVAVTVKSGPATINGNIVTLSGSVGTVVLAANQSGNDTYNSAQEVTTSFAVAYQANSITFPNISTQKIGIAFKASASASSGLPVVLTITSSNASIAGPASDGSYTITPTALGYISIAANQSGNANYAAAVQVTQNVSVTLQAQSISSFATIASQLTGSPAFTQNTPTASSGLPVTVSVKSGPASVQNNGATFTITLTGSGAVTLAADQAGNGTYAPASQITTIFNVGSLPLIAPSQIAYGITGTTFSYQVQNIGAAATGWSATGLPSGLSISSTGIISGNRTLEYRGTVQITATNSIGSETDNVGISISYSGTKYKWHEVEYILRTNPTAQARRLSWGRTDKNGQGGTATQCVWVSCINNVFYMIQQ
jgi:hypothetical protein